MLRPYAQALAISKAPKATPQPGNGSIFKVNLELTVPPSSVKVFSPGLWQFMEALGTPAQQSLAGH
jgi:hypothetical protein